jgi:hypothetical protein
MKNLKTIEDYQEMFLVYRVNSERIYNHLNAFQEKHEYLEITSGGLLTKAYNVQTESSWLLKQSVSTDNPEEFGEEYGEFIDKLILDMKVLTTTLGTNTRKIQVLNLDLIIRQCNNLKNLIDMDPKDYKPIFQSYDELLLKEIEQNVTHLRDTLYLLS